MKMLLGILGCMFLAVTLALGQEESAGGLKVEKAVAAASVEDREPVGEATEFDASAGTVSCWTKILAENPPTTIKHVWYADGEQVFEKTLDIKFASVRTWTTKTVKPGSWRVDVTDEAGTVLKSVTFTVK
jgi:hypothetical protein